MKKENHYFSDLTKLFLKAKEQENILIDNEKKSAIRNHLKAKIADLKMGQEQTLKQTDSAESGIQSIYDFFRRWRTQMMAVPGALLLLIVGVYAFNGLSGMISPAGEMPINDSSNEMLLAEGNTAQESTEQEKLDYDQALILNIAGYSKRSLNEQQAKKPELLVLDINTMQAVPQDTIKENDRPISAPSDNEPGNTNSSRQDNATYIANDQNNITVDNKNYQIADNGTTQNIPSNTDASINNNDTNNTKVDLDSDPTSDSPTQDDKSYVLLENDNVDTSDAETKEPDYVLAGENDGTQANETTDDSSSNDDDDNPTYLAYDQPDMPLTGGQPVSDYVDLSSTSTLDISDTSLMNQALIAEQKAVPSTAIEEQIQHKFDVAQSIYIEEEIVQKSYTTSYFRDDNLAAAPKLNKDILDSLTSSSIPTEVNVFYQTDIQVVIEVAEGDKSKWYLLEKTNDIWIIQEYERVFSNFSVDSVLCKDC